jgi:hypothetical protein
MWNSRNIFWVFVWWTFPFCAHLRKRIFDRFRLFFLRSFLCRRVQISHSFTRPDFFFSIGKMLRRGGRSKLVGVQQQQHQRQLLKTSAKRTKMKGNEGRREMMMTVWPCRRPNHRTPADDTLGLVSPCNNHARCVYTYIFDVCCNIPDTSVFFSPLQQQWRPINDGGEFLRISFRLILNYLAPTQRNSNIQNS